MSDDQSADPKTDLEEDLSEFVDDGATVEPYDGDPGQDPDEAEFRRNLPEGARALEIGPFLLASMLSETEVEQLAAGLLQDVQAALARAVDDGADYDAGAVMVCLSSLVIEAVRHLLGAMENLDVTREDQVRYLNSLTRVASKQVMEAAKDLAGFKAEKADAKPTELN